MDFSRRFFISAAPALTAGTIAAGSASAAAATGLISATDLGLKPNVKGDQSAALQKAITKAGERGMALLLSGGRYEVSAIRIDRPVVLQGIRGQTQLVTPNSAGIFLLETGMATLDGLSFAGADKSLGEDGALVTVHNCASLMISNCDFRDFAGSAIRLGQCAGRVTGNRIAEIGKTGVFALDSVGLEIGANHVLDIGNNGIQVWTSEQRPDGTIVAGNRIERVRVDDGGTGQNGNGIVVFRAGNVLVSHNRVSDCAYSAIRNNSGRNSQIVNNACSRLSETAIYVEFAFDGAVVSGNIVETAAAGISITNFNEGGRLAVCANNIVREITGGGSNPQKRGTAIGAEADTIVTGNIIENAADIGISAGWGAYARNIMVSGNLLRQCPIAIAPSVSAGAGPISITGNMIAQSAKAIIGMNYLDEATGELADTKATVPAHLTVSGNSVS
ncbi:TIGR03808 family TAT-translocated repetitive protein [Nordella sp. HKS 07]|uniref:TIGR03808 family TAT-translocated repetitive protein n=1 Tax=Nordella sp. HKS 07 TaxID=2712222 RepID=UPI0013E1B1B3|nr:TIGR03808 family TAT-translocated repetitive protein [Nordella sp. HKS 07]QIG49591.1 TIGR03808 family TAT-translocated repetitive protein [Nordella sp. HKS 07]